MSDLEEVCQPVSVAMVAGGHHLDTKGKLLEIETFRCPKRIRDEKRNHNLEQIRALGNREREQVLAVIVVPCIWVHSANTKKGLHVLKTLDTASALCHGEVMD